MLVRREAGGGESQQRSKAEERERREAEMVKRHRGGVAVAWSRCGGDGEMFLGRVDDYLALSIFSQVLQHASSKNTASIQKYKYLLIFRYHI